VLTRHFAYQPRVRGGRLDAAIELAPPVEILLQHRRTIPIGFEIVVNVLRGVEAESVDTLLQPELAYIDHFPAHGGIVVIQVRHFVDKDAQVMLF
jgi:hypothetical protein